MGAHKGRPYGEGSGVIFEPLQLPRALPLGALAQAALGVAQHRQVGHALHRHQLRDKGGHVEVRAGAVDLGHAHELLVARRFVGQPAARRQLG